MTESILVSPPQKSQRKSEKRQQPITAWLRARTSSIDWGREITDENGKHPIHANKNEWVLEHFRKLRNGEQSYLNRISNMMYADWFAGHIAPLYFAGASKRSQRSTLALIDIDAQKSLGLGSHRGASAFAHHLKDTHWHDLYIESSTHGVGAHAFIVIDKLGLDPHSVNQQLKELESWLRDESEGFDIENVEVKGTLPIIGWGDNKYEVTTYTAGQLAKLPRLGTPEREDELRNTTVLTTNQLCFLPQSKPARPASIKFRAKSRTSSPSTTCRTATPCGSISGKHISDDEVQKLGSHYLPIAKQLLKDVTLTLNGSRQQIVVEDVAIALMLGKFFTNNMNKDGSLPTNRWRRMWTALYNEGDIERQFSGSRFKKIRDFLSGLGLIDWEEKKYETGWKDADGKYHAGKAAKWKFSAELMSMLDSSLSSVRGGASLMRTEPITIDLATVDQPIWTPFTPDWLITHDDLIAVERTITSFEQQLTLAA